MVIKNCIYCGKEFKTKNKRTICCSHKCSGKVSALKNGKILHNSRRERRIYERQHRKLKKFCAYCNKEFNTYQYRQIYCSRSCAGKVKALKAGKQLKIKKILYKIKCQNCKQEFESKRIIKYCSDKCKKELASIRAIERKKQHKIVKLIKCKECNELFKNVYGIRNRIFCSNSCLRKYHKRVRKHFLRIKMKKIFYEKVNPIDIFNRDKWHCQNCGIKTPKQYRGTLKDNAPELDHIIPISIINSSHRYSNLQCLCRKCNQIKSNGIMDKGEQLWIAM